MRSTALVVAAFVLMSPGAVPSGQSGGKPTFGPWGVDLSGIDKSVKPGDDFFEYANGTWYKNAVIPSDRTSTGSSPNLTILSEQRMAALVNGLETSAQPNTEERKIRDLYEAYTDTGAMEKTGLAPAKKDLAIIAALETLEDVARAMGNPAVPTDGPFAVAIFTDAKDPT